VVTLLALVLKDVGFVVSISGAMFGCLLMFIVPAIMTISNIKVRPLSPAGAMHSTHRLTFFVSCPLIYF
jgi:hypothetical protein